MKFLRKTISLGLMLAMLCSTLPVGVNVDATSEYVKDGSVIIDGESLVMRSMSCYMLFCVV